MLGSRTDQGKQDQSNRSGDIPNVTESPVDFGHVWHNTLTILDADGLPPTQRAFLRQAKFVGLLDQTALLAVPDEFTKDIVETRVRQQVVTALSNQLGTEVRLAVTVDPALRAENEAEPEAAADLASLTELEADDVRDLGSPFSTLRAAASAGKTRRPCRPTTIRSPTRTSPWPRGGSKTCCARSA